MHRLPVDMSDEVTLTKPRLTGWTSVLHVLPQGENSYQPGAWSLSLTPEGSVGRDRQALERGR